MFEYHTLSNIIFLLIHPAAFVSSMLYHVLSISSENIISRNCIRAQISTVSLRLQNTLRIRVRNKPFRRPHFSAVINICNTFVPMYLFALQKPVTVTSNCRYSLNIDVCSTLAEFEGILF